MSTSGSLTTALPLTSSSASSSSTPTSSDSIHTTSSSSTSLSSSSSSSTLSTSETSSSQSSFTSTFTTPASATTSTPQLFTTTNPEGQVQTVTDFAPPSTSAPSPQNSSTPSTNSFFSNKGAVIGVFTVVGVVVLALIIALIVNAIRRRRAQNFDRDVAEAAAEAAAARSPFEDYSYPNAGGKSSGGGYGYSDNSHGTFQLPPLQPHDGPYGMTEMSQYDPYAAGAASLAAATAVGRSRSRKDSEPGAPGIAGVGAGTLGREPSRRAPYHAFAGPGPQPPQPPPELQGRNSTIRSIRGTNQDVLEAVGLAGPSGAPITSNNFTNNTGGSGAFITRKPSEATQNTQFNGRSQFGSMSSGGHHPMPLQPGYPVDSYYPQRNDNHSPDPFAPYPPPKVANVSSHVPNPHAGTVQSPLPPGPQSDLNGDFADSQSALRSEERRVSYQDDTDYSQGSRVLRVTNE